MTFAQSSNKQKHERTHTKEKLYTCSFCPKAFGRSDHKLLHERSHEKKRTGNRFYASSAASSAFLSAAQSQPRSGKFTEKRDVCFHRLSAKRATDCFLGFGGTFLFGLQR